MADMKYDIDSSDLIRARKEVKQWSRDNQAAFNQVNSTMQRTGKVSELAFNQFGRAATQAQQKSKRFASVGLQQVGYQVGDFAVQIQSGTNAAVAFGQQMSQLLGIFGAGGAIAGAGVAIASAFIAPLLDMRKAAREADEAISNFTSALGDYRDQAELSRRTTQDLQKEFGDLAGDMRELSAFFQEVAVSRAMEALKTGTATFSIELEDAAERASLLNSEMERLGNPQPGSDRFALVATLKNRAEDAADALGLTTDQAILLQDSISSIDESQSLVSLRDNTLQALKTIEGISYESGQIPPEIAKVVEKLKEVLGASTRATAEMENTENSASGIADALGRAVSAMSSLSGFTAGLDKALEVSLSKVKAIESGTDSAIAGRITKLRIDLEEKVEGALQAGVSPVTASAERFTGLATISQIEESEGRLKTLSQRDKGTSGGSVGSGGGGGLGQESSMQKLVKQVELNEKLLGMSEARQQVLKALGDEASNYNQKQIDAVVQRIQAYDMEKQALEDARQQMQTMADTLESSMSNAFMTMVEGTVSFKDAMRDMARAVIKQLFDILVVQKLVGSFDSTSGKGSGIVGSIMGLFANANGNAFNNGKVTAFADGGVVSKPTMFPMANGMGLMGEAGPEAVMPLKRGKNGKLGVSSDGGSGNGPVTINQSFNFSANGDESVKRIIQGEAPKIAAMTEKQIINSRRRGGSMKQAFG